MRRHATRNVNANRSYLALSVACPCTRQSRDALGWNAKVSASTDQNLFQPPHKLHGSQSLSLAIRRSETAQVKDGITDKLARAVKGHVATTIAIKDFDAAHRELLVRHNHVGSFCVPTKCDDGSVFEQQQNIANEAIFAKLNELLLQA